MTQDYTGSDRSQYPSEWPPLDIQAFLHGDVQGRENVLLGDDRRAVEEYAKQWRIPAWDYFRRREAREAKQYGYFGSCPKCGAEGGSYVWPYNDDWFVCSAGCEVRWLIGAGFFRDMSMFDLPEEKLRELVEKLFHDYEEVEPLGDWKAEELPIDPQEADVGIRIMKLDDVGGCAICGFDAIPEDLRKLANHHLLGTLIDGSWVPRVPLLSLAHRAPLCMVCGEEVSHRLQEDVNGSWGLGKGSSGPCRIPQ
jgi:hypothetical protein